MNILDQAAFIACNLQPGQHELTAHLPIYNRPVRIVEVLNILIFHIGLVHSAQVTEPIGLPPLWTQYSPEFRHRIIGRTMLPLSLLYRRDIGGSLRTTFDFRIDGPDGGEWYVNVSPDFQSWGEGVADRFVGLTISADHRQAYFCASCLDWRHSICNRRDCAIIVSGQRSAHPLTHSERGRNLFSEFFDGRYLRAITRSIS